MLNEPVLALVSGGIESTTLVAWLLRRRHPVTAITFDYGQVWKNEIPMTQRLCGYYGIKCIVKEIGRLSVMQIAQPKGYSTTFIAMRNPMLLSHAINQAFSLGIHTVAYGAEMSVHSDATPEFVDRFNFMVEEAMRPGLYKTWAPFTGLEKYQVIREAAKLRAPMHLSFSCQENKGLINCGECSSCEWRLKSFAKALYQDPASYATSVVGRSGKRPFPYYGEPTQWRKEFNKAIPAS